MARPPTPGRTSKAVVGLGGVWMVQEQPFLLQTSLRSFLAAIGPSLLPQNHRLHHPLLPLGQGDPAGAAGVKRERSAGQRSPGPRPIYAPPSRPNSAPSHPEETGAPGGHTTPAKEKHHPAGKNRSRAAWEQPRVKSLLDGSTGTSPVPSSPPSSSPMLGSGWRRLVGARRERPRSRHPSAL